MWRSEATASSPTVRRGEVSELERSPGGSLHGCVSPVSLHFGGNSLKQTHAEKQVDTEELFPLAGFRFRADSQVYPESLPYLSPRLPVTCETRPGAQAANIGVDYARLPHGTLDSYNGRSGWIRDEDQQRSVFFDNEMLLNSSRPLLTYETKLAYLPNPSSDLKALLVYPEHAEPGHAADMGQKETPGPASYPFRRPRGLAIQQRLGSLSSYDDSPASSRSPSPIMESRRPSLPPLPHFNPLPSAALGRYEPSYRAAQNSRVSPSTPARLFGTMPPPPLSPLQTSYGHMQSRLPPRSPLRRRMSATTLNAPEMDPFAGSEGFERMPVPSIQRHPFSPTRQRAPERRPSTLPMPSSRRTLMAHEDPFVRPATTSATLGPSGHSSRDGSIRAQRNGRTQR